MAVKLVLVALLWGGTFIAGRVLAQTMPPMSAAWCRYLVAAILLVALSRRRPGGLPHLDRSQLVLTAGLGATGIFLYNVFFFEALSRLPAGRTALFVSLNPIMTAIAASIVFRERLDLRRWTGIALALCGALVVITRGDLAGTLGHLARSFGRGEVMMLMAVVAWAAYTLVSRPAASTLTPLVATTYATLWGLGFLTIGAVGQFGAIEWSALNWQAWVSILYLGGLGTVVAFIWYSEGIRAVGPSRTAVFTNLVPAFGVLLAAVLLGESVLVSMLVGGALAAAGVSLANRAPS